MSRFGRANGSRFRVCQDIKLKCEAGLRVPAKPANADLQRSAVSVGGLYRWRGCITGRGVSVGRVAAVSVARRYRSPTVSVGAAVSAGAAYRWPTVARYGQAGCLAVSVGGCITRRASIPHLRPRRLGVWCIGGAGVVVFALTRSPRKGISTGPR